MVGSRRLRHHDSEDGLELKRRTLKCQREIRRRKVWWQRLQTSTQQLDTANETPTGLKTGMDSAVLLNAPDTGEPSKDCT